MTKKNWNVWSFKRFFSPLKGNAWTIIKNILVNCFYSFFTILTVEVFKKATTLVQDNDSEWVKELIIIYVIVIIVFIIFNRCCRHTGAGLRHDWRRFIQKKILPEFFKLDNTSVEKMWTWKIQQIMNSWIDNWRSLYVKLTQKIPDLVILTIFVLYQIYEIWGWKYIWIFFLLFWFVFSIVLVLNKKWLAWRQKKEWVSWEHWRQFVKMIMSKMEIVQNNQEKSEIEKDDKILLAARDCDFRINTVWWLLYWTWNLFSLLLNIFILYYWWRIVVYGGDLSLFVGLLASATLFQKVLDNSIILYKEFTNEFATVQRLRDTFDSIPNMRNKYSEVLFKYKKWDIEIDDMTFSYDNKSKVFENFSLNIDGWKRTALVWESGSWKSTLMKLIAWYILPDEWDILVDGQNISEINIYNYFSHIGFLTQDPSVFDWTIYENLIYALKEEPSAALLKKIIKAAKCEFIYDFTEWLQTEIWEKWIRLSWGQKQRLAIAKIMLKNPDIILLDEPTSALDSFNEEEISQALTNLFKWKTVIIVAHRLQTVKSADRILLFEKWKVIEDWTHQSLIRKNWKYKKMLDLQSGF